MIRVNNPYLYTSAMVSVKFNMNLAWGDAERENSTGVDPTFNSMSLLTVTISIDIRVWDTNDCPSGNSLATDFGWTKVPLSLTQPQNNWSERLFLMWCYICWPKNELRTLGIKICIFILLNVLFRENYKITYLFLGKAKMCKRCTDNFFWLFLFKMCIVVSM